MAKSWRPNYATVCFESSADIDGPGGTDKELGMVLWGDSTVSSMGSGEATGERWGNMLEAVWGTKRGSKLLAKKNARDESDRAD